MICVRFWFIAVALVGSAASAAPQDDLLYREALKADQRMYDNVQAFAKALRAALGADPKMSALEVSENTGSALLRLDDGQTRSFSFVEGKLSETSSSALRDEAPRDQALARRFTFDAIDLNKVRAVLKAQRAKPGHAGDTAPDLMVGYRAIVGRLLVSVQLGSMATGGLDLVSYDFYTGESVDLKGIVDSRNAEVEAHNARVRAQERAFEEENKRLAKINMLGLGAEAVQTLHGDVGAPPHFRNVVLEVEQVRMTILDSRAGFRSVTYRYDRAKKLTRLDSPESEITKCQDSFAAEDFDWTMVPQFVEQAFVALGVDRDAEIRVDVERPNRCGPVHAQVSLDKSHHINGAYFDRSGRLFKVD
jgi:hypothetical protein